MGVGHPFIQKVGRSPASCRVAAHDHLDLLVVLGLVALSATTQWVAAKAPLLSGAGRLYGSIPEGWAQPALLLAVWLAAIALWLALSRDRRVDASYLGGAACLLGLASFGPLHVPGAFVLWVLEPQPLASVAKLATAAWTMVALVVLLGALHRRSAPEPSLHGSARFAESRDLVEHGLLEQRGVVLGWHRGTGWRWHPIRHQGVEHVLVLGETRAGKTSEQLIPTLLSWHGHVVIGDFKDGELYERTAGALKERDFRVIRFDPLSGAGASWNPLLEIEPGEEEIGQLMTLAEALIMLDPRGNDHFPKAAREMFVALALDVLYTPGHKSLGEVRRLLLENLGGEEETSHHEAGAGLHRLFERLASRQHDPGKLYADFDGLTTHPEVRRISVGLRDTPEKELGSIGSTLRQALQPWADPMVQRTTARSDVKLGLVRRDPKPTAIYMTIPLAEMERLAPLIRLFVVAAAKRLTELGSYVDQAADSRQIHRALMVLEEFPSMGKVEYVSRMLSTVGGYGLTMMLCVQTLSQLKTTYGNNEPISGGCPVMVVNPTKDLDTMRAVSRWSGEMTVLRPKINRTSSWKSGASTSRSVDEVKRPLITEGEVRLLPRGRGLIFYPSCPPILSHKRGYYRIPELLRASEVKAPEGSDRLVDPICPWGAGQPVRQRLRLFESDETGEADAS